MEEQTKWQIFSNNIFNVLVLAVAFYLMYLIGNVAWKNYHVDQQVNDLKEKMNVMQIENESMQDYLTFYKTKTYQELELRRRLMLKKPGENVVLLPIRKADDRSIVVSQEKQLIEYKKEQNKLPNYYKWWLMIAQG